MSKFILVIFACLLISAQCDEREEKRQEARKKCQNETGVKIELIEKAAKGDLTNDPNLKCYIKCIMIAYGTFENDKVKEDDLIAAIPESIWAKAVPAIRKCKTQPGEDVCDIAYNTHVCYKKRLLRLTICSECFVEDAYET